VVALANEDELYSQACSSCRSPGT